MQNVIDRKKIVRFEVRSEKAGWVAYAPALSRSSYGNYEFLSRQILQL